MSDKTKNKKEKIFARRYEEDLKDLRRYIEEFSLFLPLPMCMVNPPGIVTDTNLAFYKLTGYREIKTRGGRVTILRIETIFEDKKAWKELEKRILDREIIKGKEIIVVTKDKKRIPISLSASYRENEEGDFIGYFLAFFDITEIKELRDGLEDKVRERTKELQERVEELEKFHKLTVGRELKMTELKEEIRTCRAEARQNLDSLRSTYNLELKRLKERLKRYQE